MSSCLQSLLLDLSTENPPLSPLSPLRTELDGSLLPIPPIIFDRFQTARSKGWWELDGVFGGAIFIADEHVYVLRTSGVPSCHHLVLCEIAVSAAIGPSPPGSPFPWVVVAASESRAYAAWVKSEPDLQTFASCPVPSFLGSAIVTPTGLALFLSATTGAVYDFSYLKESAGFFNPTGAALQTTSGLISRFLSNQGPKNSLCCSSSGRFAWSWDSESIAVFSLTEGFSAAPSVRTILGSGVWRLGRNRGNPKLVQIFRGLSHVVSVWPIGDAAVVELESGGILVIELSASGKFQVSGPFGASPVTSSGSSRWQRQRASLSGRRRVVGVVCAVSPASRDSLLIAREDEHSGSISFFTATGSEGAAPILSLSGIKGKILAVSSLSESSEDHLGIFVSPRTTNKIILLTTEGMQTASLIPTEPFILSLPAFKATLEEPEGAKTLTGVIRSKIFESLRYVWNAPVVSEGVRREVGIAPAAIRSAVEMLTVLLRLIKVPTPSSDIAALLQAADAAAQLLNLLALVGRRGDLLACPGLPFGQLLVHPDVHVIVGETMKRLLSIGGSEMREELFMGCPSFYAETGGHAPSKETPRKPVPETPTPNAPVPNDYVSPAFAARQLAIFGATWPQGKEIFLHAAEAVTDLQDVLVASKTIAQRGAPAAELLELVRRSFRGILNRSFSGHTLSFFTGKSDTWRPIAVYEFCDFIISPSCPVDTALALTAVAEESIARGKAGLLPPLPELMRYFRTLSDDSIPHAEAAAVLTAKSGDWQRAGQILGILARVFPTRLRQRKEYFEAACEAIARAGGSGLASVLDELTMLQFIQMPLANLDPADKALNEGLLDLESLAAKSKYLHAGEPRILCALMAGEQPALLAKILYETEEQRKAAPSKAAVLSLIQTCEQACLLKNLIDRLDAVIASLEYRALSVELVAGNGPEPDWLVSALPLESSVMFDVYLRVFESVGVWMEWLPRGPDSPRTDEIRTHLAKAVGLHSQKLLVTDPTVKWAGPALACIRGMSRFCSNEVIESVEAKIRQRQRL